MNYLQKNNTQKSIFQKIIIGFTIFIFLCSIRFFFSGNISSGLFVVVEPVWHMRDVVFGYDRNALMSNTQNDPLAGDTQALRSDIYALQLKNLELQAGIDTLTKELSIQTINEGRNRRTVKVLSKPPYSPYDIFIINSGSADGVTLDAQVFIGGNTLIGTVTKIENRFAEVTLYSSGSRSFDSRVLRTGETILVQGNGGGNFEVTVPKDFDVTVGDVFVDGTVSQHIIAQVYSIDSSSQGSFKKVFARIPVNVFQTEWVGVENIK